MTGCGTERWWVDTNIDWYDSTTKHHRFDWGHSLVVTINWIICKCEMHSSICHRICVIHCLHSISLSLYPLVRWLFKLRHRLNWTDNNFSVFFVIYSSLKCCLFRFVWMLLIFVSCERKLQSKEQLRLFRVNNIAQFHWHWSHPRPRSEYLFLFFLTVSDINVKRWRV